MLRGTSETAPERLPGQQLCIANPAASGGDLVSNHGVEEVSCHQGIEMVKFVGALGTGTGTTMLAALEAGPSTLVLA